MSDIAGFTFFGFLGAVLFGTWGALIGFVVYFVGWFLLADGEKG